MVQIEKALLGVALAAFVSSSQGEDYKEIKVTALDACGKYLAARERHDSSAYAAVTWAIGFMSGYNVHSSHAQIHVPDGDTTSAYLDKFCRDYPLLSVSTGVAKLIGDLGGYKPPDPVWERK